MNKTFPRATALLLCLAASPGFSAPRDHKQADWLGADMPLPLPVHSAQDLTFKAQTERQYLVFNLMAAGKVAWDAGDYATAADKWEALLQVPKLDPEIDKAVRPFALDARARAGKPGTAVLPPPPAPAAEPESAVSAAAPKRRASSTVVDGTISGGGAAGPGGAVITLHRADGKTPLPAPLKERVILQHDKMFAPHVMAIPVGTTIVFRNSEDAKAIYHDVFSLSPAAKFDTGLYEAPTEKTHQFDSPGVVQLLCNIHAKMSGYIDVVDTPWFAQADGKGAFHISGVPPGDYDVEVWHELAAHPTRAKLTVTREGAHLTLSVGADRVIDPNPPDKAGKPRQEQLPY